MRGEISVRYRAIAARAVFSSICIDTEAAQGVLKLLVKLGMGKLGGSGLDHHRELRTGAQACPLNPEVLTQPTFKAIPADRIADLAANTEAQSGSAGAGGCYHNEMCGMAAVPMAPEL